MSTIITTIRIKQYNQCSNSCSIDENVCVRTAVVLKIRNMKSGEDSHDFGHNGVPFIRVV